MRQESDIAATAVFLGRLEHQAMLPLGTVVLAAFQESLDTLGLAARVAGQGG